MSAIAAIWYRDGRTGEDAIRRMSAALAPYGSDRAGQWHEGPVALASRLMAVLPEDQYDRQPLVDQDVTIVATARLDNRAELASALGLDPLRARHTADADFIRAAYRRWGEACLDHLLGDFSFAIWDRNRNRMFCARDPLGRHPLVYHSSPRMFALASMPKGLLALTEVPRELDEGELIRRLRIEGIPPSDTPNQAHWFAGLRTLPGGHSLTVTRTGEMVRRYWAPDRTRRLSLKDGEYIEAFRALFDEAVRCRLRGAGKIASQLSGGLDSSAVTSTAARLLGEREGGLTAYTAAPRIGYASGWPLDESPMAALTAAGHANISHRVLRPDGSTPLDAIRRTLVLADRAPLNPCNSVWEHQIYADAHSRGVRVLLSGAMGNGTISYDGQGRLVELFRQGRWLTLRRELHALPTPVRGHLASLLRPYLPTALRARLQSRARRERPHVSALHPDVRAQLERQERAAPRPRAVDDGFSLRARMLTRMDQGPFNAAAAGWGIDLRDPTADQRIVEFCLALPEEQYLAGGVTRRLVRRAFAGALPDQVLHQGAEQKGRQAADYHEQMASCRDELIAEIERMAKIPLALRCLDLTRMRRLLTDWPKDGWRDPAVTADYRMALLRGVAIGCFILDVHETHG